MAKIKIKVPVDIYDELFRLLEAGGVQLKPDDDLVISKDIKMEMPGVNYKQVTIRRDVLTAVVPAYKAPVTESDYEVTDSAHFIKFVDDAYNYIMTGEKPKPEPTATTNVVTPKGWK